jgi:peptidoglycan/LPS O-acetylase OafA/YrhL
MSDANSLQGPVRLPALDAVRAIGAIAVLVYHVAFNTGISLSGMWAGLLARLDVGVAVFFVLSGFLLFRPYAHALAAGQHRPGTWRYLWRRALRIMPAYWAAVIVCLAVLPQNQGASTEIWVRHLTLTQIYGAGELRPGLGQTWSLATEVTFYLVLPITAIVVSGRRWRPVRMLWIVIIGGLLVTAGWVAGSFAGLVAPWPQNLWLPAYAAWFAAGIALAVIHVGLGTSTAPRSWRVLDEVGAAPLACWTMAVALLAVASTPIMGPRDLSPQSNAEFAAKLVLYLAIAVLVLIPVAFAPANRVRAAFSSAPARWLGAISYGIFLWHPFILDWIYRPGGRPVFSGDPLSTLVITLAGALTLASISYYVLERPIQRWGARWPRRRAGVATDTHIAVAAASATT